MRKQINKEMKKEEKEDRIKYSIKKEEVNTEPWVPPPRKKNKFALILSFTLRMVFLCPA